MDQRLVPVSRMHACQHASMQKMHKHMYNTTHTHMHKLPVAYIFFKGKAKWLGLGLGVPRRAAVRTSRKMAGSE